MCVCVDLRKRFSASDWYDLRHISYSTAFTLRYAPSTKKGKNKLQWQRKGVCGLCPALFRIWLRFPNLTDVMVEVHDSSIRPWWSIYGARPTVSDDRRAVGEGGCGAGVGAGVELNKIILRTSYR